MPITYAARLRRDLRIWEGQGLIEGTQRARIEAHAIPVRSWSPLQAAVHACMALLGCIALAAFLLALWPWLGPSGRIQLLVGFQVVAIAVAWHLGRRTRRRSALNPSPDEEAIAEFAAIVALGLSVATVIPLWLRLGFLLQVERDLEPLLVTVSLTGLGIALVTRSTCVAFVTAIVCLASLQGIQLPGIVIPTPIMWDWLAGLVAAGLAAMAATRWTGCRPTILLLLLLIVCGLGAESPEAPRLTGTSPSLAFAVSLVALAAGQAMAFARPGLAAALPGFGEALSRAAGGVALIGILFGILIGLEGAPPFPTRGGDASALLPLGSALGCAIILVLARRRMTSGFAAGHTAVLCGCLLALLQHYLHPNGIVDSAHGSLDRSVVATHVVWGGIVPALALAVGPLADRRNLLGGLSLMVATLFAAMALAITSNPIGLSMELLGACAAFGVALYGLRRIARRDRMASHPAPLRASWR